MSHRQSPSRLGSCILAVVILLCLAIITGYFATNTISHQAEQIFGVPSAQLSTPQRLYLSTLILLQANDLTQPANPAGVDTRFTINQGESVPSITGRLWQAGLINNPGVFRNYLQYAGMDTSLKSGDFKLSPAMTPIEIAGAIQSSISAEVTLTILSGWRVDEIANSIPTTGLNITREEFLQAAHSQPAGYSFSSCLSDSSLEGFLYPDSYVLLRETTVDDLLTRILMNFEDHLTPELKSGFTNQNLDLCQAVTLASIIQREAVVSEEMPLIASVFFNRLRNGSVLASDPTVQYALGFNNQQNTWWTNPLSLQDLKVDSPYNTYIYGGLPPGPISNPGLAALDAVAFPAQTPYYYFRSACDGSGRHLFAETYQEHVANACP